MYKILWYFLIFSFLGWCMEVAYHTVCCGDFSNRGFLNGPVCPIYGFGAVLLILILRPFSHSLYLLFIFAVFITSILEFLTGYVLEKAFNMKWWDYSDTPFNIKGYICLKFSLAWGAAGTFLIRVVLPFCDKIILKIPFTLGVIFICVLGACYLADAIYTVVILRSLKQRIKLAEKISTQLRQLSNDIGIHISDSVFDIMDKADDVAKLGKAKVEEFEMLKAQYKEKISELNFSHKRIIKAFPSLSSKRYKHSLEQIKKHIAKKREE